jgi:hypothetical protein
VRRAASAGLLAALALSAVAGAAVPSLRMVRKTPLVLEGRGFVAGEAVRVTVVTGYGPRVQRLTTPRGVFRVVFRVPATGCGAAYAARAVGSRGSIAAVRLGAVCIPPPY